MAQGVVSGLYSPVTASRPTRYSVAPSMSRRAAEMMAPPALRPAVVILLAMLAAPGKSILRNVYMIKRGYQDFAERLKELGAEIEAL